MQFLWWFTLSCSQSEHAGSSYTNDVLIDLFFFALTGVVSPRVLVQWFVFEASWTAGTTIQFTDVKKAFISLEEHSSRDTFSECSLKGAHAVDAMPLPPTTNQFQGWGRTGQGQDHGQGHESSHNFSHVCGQHQASSCYGPASRIANVTTNDTQFKGKYFICESLAT